MKKTLFVLLITVFFVAGCSSSTDKSTKEEEQTTTEPEFQTTMIKEKQEGNLTYYSGEVSVSGTYKEYGPDAAFLGKSLCFYVDNQTTYLIPREPNLFGEGSGDDRPAWFCFSNQDEAKKMFKVDENTAFTDPNTECLEGTADITISNYIVDSTESEVTDKATLESVISSTPQKTEGCKWGNPYKE